MWHVQIFLEAEEETYETEEEADRAAERHNRVSNARTRVFEVDGDVNET